MDFGQEPSTAGYERYVSESEHESTDGEGDVSGGQRRAAAATAAATTVDAAATAAASGTKKAEAGAPEGYRTLGRNGLSSNSSKSNSSSNSNSNNNQPQKSVLDLHMCVIFKFKPLSLERYKLCGYKPQDRDGASQMQPCGALKMQCHANE